MTVPSAAHIIATLHVVFMFSFIASRSIVFPPRLLWGCTLTNHNYYEKLLLLVLLIIFTQNCSYVNIKFGICTLWRTSCCNNYYTKECSKLVFQPLQNVVLLIHYCFVSFIHSCRILLVRTTEN